MSATISPRKRSLIVDKDGDYLDINPDGSLNTESKIIDSDGHELDVNVDGSINVNSTIVSPLESNGAVPINIQDQHTRAFDVFFSQTIGSPTTLTTDAVINTYSVSLTAGHGTLVGEQLVVYDVGSDRVYVGKVLTTATNTVGLNVPLNFNYPSATSVVARSTKEMNVDGSVTRQTFAVSPPIQSPVDITRVMFQMITTDYPELNMFGDIAGGLARGIVFRVVNGINVNYFYAQDNADLSLLMYDVKDYEAAKHGVNGLGGRMTYASPGKHGVAIRLETGDSLEVIIQDNLTSILKLRMLAVGHVVGD